MTLVEELYAALAAAQAHLDWAGYGDAWERECARAAGLPEQIEGAMQRAAREGVVLVHVPLSSTPVVPCVLCQQFFSRFSCNRPGECDCPRCQSTCRCAENTPESTRPEDF